MSARRTVAFAVLAGAAALVALSRLSGDTGPTAHPPPPSATLPEGAGRELAEHACLICHSAMLITQQRKDSTAWEKTVRQMETWGAPVPPAEHDSLRLYLTTQLGPAPR